MKAVDIVPPNCPYNIHVMFKLDMSEILVSSLKVKKMCFCFLVFEKAHKQRSCVKFFCLDRIHVDN